ncbi:MAG TPA: Fic family protein [Planctomycetota bacterium]|nr:Fic family protein [Planctomycetota bacterium]
MTTKRQPHKCPDWSDDSKEREKAAFRVASKQVYRLVESSASHQLLTQEAVRSWHRLLFKDIVPLDYYAGNFRQVSSERPCLNGYAEIAGRFGSPPHLVTKHMQTLVLGLRAHVASLELHWEDKPAPDRALFLAQIIGWLVGNYIRIHPFMNGNGRTSRLLWAWGLLRFELPAQCRIGLRPNPPYSELMEAAMKGDDTPLQLYILRNMAEVPRKAAK